MGRPDETGGRRPRTRRISRASSIHPSHGIGPPGHRRIRRPRAADKPDGNRWWSHVTALANDGLEGRETGSAGHRKAAAYVAGQFEKLGLKPAGTDGYIQPVNLKSKRIDEARSRLDLVRGGKDEALTLGDDAIISPRVDPAPSVEADLVFVGHGLTIPEADHDDFRGLDVRGKLVVYLGGAPPSIPGPLAAHMQSMGERAANLRRVGAIGIVSIQNPKNMDIPWERAALARFMPAMSLADPAMDESAASRSPSRSTRPMPISSSPARGTPSARSSTRPTPAKCYPTSRSRRG